MPTHPHKPDPVKIKLTIAYDGSRYQGWQVQKIGLGVQEKVEAAVGRLFPSVKRIYSSSRTDTGVHAMGMVVDFDIPAAEFTMPVRKLVLAINAWLPEDIRVMAAQPAPAHFHARYDAVRKQYRYVIWNAPALNPLLRHHAWHVPRPLNLQAMRAAARMFVGRHDFKSFANKRGYELASTERTLFRCDLKRSGPLLTLILEGDGFLYKMCRAIAGTLVQVGLGKFAASHVKRMFDQKDRCFAGMTAPAHGLVLWKVVYPKKSVVRSHRLATNP